MQLEELRPGRSRRSEWGGIDAVLAKNVPDGGAGDTVADLPKLSLDPLIAPVAILSGHADDQFSDGGHDAGSPGAS